MRQHTLYFQIQFGKLSLTVLFYTLYLKFVSVIFKGFCQCRQLCDLPQASVNLIIQEHHKLNIQLENISCDLEETKDYPKKVVQSFLRLLSLTFSMIPNQLQDESVCKKQSFIYEKYYSKGKNSGPCCILYILLYYTSIYVLCYFFRFPMLAWELIREPAGVQNLCIKYLVSLSFPAQGEYKLTVVRPLRWADLSTDTHDRQHSDD